MTNRQRKINLCNSATKHTAYLYHRVMRENLVKAAALAEKEKAVVH